MQRRFLPLAVAFSMMAATADGQQTDPQRGEESSQAAGDGQAPPQRVSLERRPAAAGPDQPTATSSSAG